MIFCEKKQPKKQKKTTTKQPTTKWEINRKLIIFEHMFILRPEETLPEV